MSRGDLKFNIKVQGLKLILCIEPSCLSKPIQELKVTFLKILPAAPSKDYFSMIFLLQSRTVKVVVIKNKVLVIFNPLCEGS